MSIRFSSKVSILSIMKFFLVQRDKALRLSGGFFPLTGAAVG
jgi:hypothetical protein